MKFNEIRIPRRFMIFGNTIDVELRSDLVISEDMYGKAMLDKNRIALQAIAPGFDYSKERQEQEFFHELLEFLLSAAEIEIEDHGKLNILAKCLHQAFKTAEYV